MSFQVVICGKLVHSSPKASSNVVANNFDNNVESKSGLTFAVSIKALYVTSIVIQIFHCVSVYTTVVKASIRHQVRRLPLGERLRGGRRGAMGRRGIAPCQ